MVNLSIKTFLSLQRQVIFLFVYLLSKSLLQFLATMSHCKYMQKLEIHMKKNKIMNAYVRRRDWGAQRSGAGAANGRAILAPFV